MPENDDPLVLRALEQIEVLTAKVLRLKMFVNEADDLNNRAPRFSELGFVPLPPSTSQGTRPSARWNPGEFLNRPFSSAVRSILLRRAEIAGAPSPASVDDIHDA